MSLVRIRYTETSHREAEIEVPDDWDGQRIRDAFERYRVGDAEDEDDVEFAEGLDAASVEVDGGCDPEVEVEWVTRG